MLNWSRVGFGAARFPPSPRATRGERIERARQMLARALNLRTVVAVVGSGCSQPLGYPGWSSFVREIVEHAVAALEQRPAEPGLSAALDGLRDCEKQTRSAATLEPTDLMYYLGRCHWLLDSLRWEVHPYAQYVQNRFDHRGKEALRTFDGNPHRALTELRISRFVTTNYDCELELALAAAGLADFEEFGIGAATVGEPLSFTQELRDCDRLALFALARPSRRPMVFHCHGRFDHPRSIIATEEDYQQWYLQTADGLGGHFREAIRLLFGSNPLLFIGYSLRDEDLLHPLRELGANDPGRKKARPVFALLPEAEEGAEWHRHQVLFERYGVNVIPYSSSASSGDDEKGKDLASAILGLGQIHDRWLDGWLQKPVIRKVVIKARPPRPYHHYSLDLRGHVVLGEQRVRENLDGFVSAARRGARVLCLVGPGGGGKSWHAIRLLERVEREVSEFEGFFFWSSYYADDYLTGLERALAYLDPDGKVRGPRHRRLAECLKGGRYFLVFDGFERLLREADDPEVGVPFGKGAQQLLDALTDAKSQSMVVITSRLRPAGLQESARVVVSSLERLRAEDLRSSPLLAPFETHLPALCSLLDGHAYGLLLAGEYLHRRFREEDPEGGVQSLKRALAASAPDRRMSRMIGLMLKDLSRSSAGLVETFLERVAVFMSPLSDQALEICLQEAWADLGHPGSRPEIAEMMTMLLNARLLFPVVTSESGHEPPAYTVHPTVRSYLFFRAHRATPEVLPNFTLPGFTSGTAMASPGSHESAVIVKGIFDRLLAEARAALDRGALSEARDLCRHAFSALRSRLEAITAPRWTSYPEYLQLGLKLANLAKEVAPRVWDYRERHLLNEVEDPDGPLFADELAWLYNDIGLTLCAEGDMHDSYGVWEQGYELNRVIEGGEDPGQYVVQSQLNLSRTFIEMGLLQNAEHYLRQTERSNLHLKDPDYSGRIVGELALIAHLRGDLERGDHLYQDALKLIEEGGGNPRAESIFKRHWADLKLARDEPDEAEDLLRTSRVLAEIGHYPDLVAFTVTSQGHVHRQRGRVQEARLDYEAALARARKFGVRRLEADVLSELSRLALDLGDTETARVRAMESMAIANELGLGLRQTHGLVVLGIAALRGSHRDLGLAYLRNARTLAAEQQYWSRGREAESLLQAAGEPLGFEW